MLANGSDGFGFGSGKSDEAIAKRRIYQKIFKFVKQPNMPLDKALDKDAMNRLAE